MSGSPTPDLCSRRIELALYSRYGTQGLPPLCPVSLSTRALKSRILRARGQGTNWHKRPPNDPKPSAPPLPTAYAYPGASRDPLNSTPWLPACKHSLGRVPPFHPTPPTP